jgi:hypothetical protein
MQRHQIQSSLVHGENSRDVTKRLDVETTSRRRGMKALANKISALHECLIEAYLIDYLGKRRVRYGVRVNPLQKGLRVSCTQVRRELLAKIMLFLVISNDYEQCRVPYSEIDASFTCLSLETRWTLHGKAGIYSRSEALINKTTGEQLVRKDPRE